MSRREVTHSGKDRDRDITALCNPLASWSPRWKADAIRDIENQLHTYFVRTKAGEEVNVVVRQRGTVKYLTTDPDKTKKNNLDDLPDC